MKHYARLAASLVSFSLSLLPASPALALANRVFVSARSGNNANSCDNILTPCQTFAGAVLQLNPGGEAIVLDSGAYGPVTITKSLTIEAPPGVLAFIHPPSGYAITVSAGSSDVVTLRGLILNGGLASGIFANTVGTLHIENCVISGFSGNGIWYDASAGEMFVKDTIVRQDGLGIAVSGGRASIEHCRMEENVSYGVYVDGGDVTVRDSEAAGNLYYGFAVINGGSESSVLNVYQCVSTHNSSDGFLAQKSGSGYVIARVASSWISGNLGVGLNNVSTTSFESLGNNFVQGNVGGDTSGTITVAGGK